MKFLAYLPNVDEVIRDEDKAVILLSSLPDEGHATFVLTLINEKPSLRYFEVTTALLNLNLRRKDKESFNGISAKVS